MVAFSNPSAILGFWELDAVADKFDPYREALVMEHVTVWPEEYDELEPAEKARAEAALHAKPDACADLEYVRVHTGFCRKITVTPDDFERIRGK